MGLVCCKPDINTPNAETAFKNSMMEGISFPTLNIADVKNLKLNAEIDLYSLITEKVIVGLLKKTGEYLKDPDIKKYDKLLLNEKLQLLKNDFKLWVRLSNQEKVPYKLHTYYLEVNFPFTPELLYLYYLNVNKDNYEHLHKDLDEYEVLHMAFKDDYCLMLLKYRTKSVIMIESRSFFVLRVVRRNKDRTFSEFQISVNRTHLSDIAVFRSIIDSMENEATVYLNGSEFEQTPEGLLLKSFTKVDVLSHLGILAVKPVIKTSAKQSKNTLMSLLVEFLLVKQDLAKLKWFNDSLSEKRRIFDENIKILSEAKLDLTQLEPEIQAIYVAKYAWKKKKGTDNFTKREIDPAPSAHEFYETVEDINEDKDKIIAGMKQKIDTVAKELEMKVEHFKNKQIDRKLSNLNDETLKMKVSKQIDDINQEIEKRSNATKEMLENSYNEGSYVEDLQRKVDMDLHKLSEQLNYQLKKVAKKSFHRNNKDHIHKTAGEEEKVGTILRSDSITDVPQITNFTGDDVADGEEIKDAGDGNEDKESDKKTEEVPKEDTQQLIVDQPQIEPIPIKVIKKKRKKGRKLSINK